MGSRLEKNSNDVKKRIAGHTFDGEDGEEYSASKFGGFGDYMRRKKIKLQNLDAEIRSQSDKPQIFKNIVAHVNGYTQPSLADLHTLIVTHGGGFQQYLDGKTTVTHIIASQLTPKKKVEFARYRIVKPAWVVDSVAAGRLLPWENYRAVDEGVTQKVLGFEKGQVVSQINSQKQGYRDQTETSWYASQVQHVAEKLNSRHNDNTFGHLPDQEGEDGDDDDRFDNDFDFEDLATAIVDDNLQQETLPSKGPQDAVPTELAQIKETIQPRPNTIDPLCASDPKESDHLARSKSPQKADKRPLTAEEHNAILLQNPHMAKSSTANPDFINQYYRESRLHHLSMWKAELKAQLQVRAEESASQRKKPRRAPGSRRYVMHVDFDSFFAAVSLKKNPQLKDRPVAIAHGSGPGSEIASCNYPARNYGVKNGMWMRHALKLCPSLKVLPYDYKAYEEASKHFYDSILALDGIVQSISIDEALIDVTEMCIRTGEFDEKGIYEISIDQEQAKAIEVADLLRSSIREKTGCEVSVGIGNNILLAKVALRKAKPAGQHLIKPEDVLDFLADLTVTDLPGVAYSIGNKLEEIGVKLVKDIRALTKEKLINALGPKTGEKLWDYSRGIDRQEVGEQVVRKSVSAEVNWGIRFLNQQQAEEFVYALCEELSKRLLEQLVKGRQLTMKIMRKAADAGMDPPKNLGHGKCDTFNKSVVLGLATYDKFVLGKEAVSILRGYGFPPGELRGLGVQMQKLEPLKPASNTHATAIVDGSQRRLQFKKPDTIPKTPKQSLPSTVVASRSHASILPPERDEQQSPLFMTSKVQNQEPIEEVPTPEKPNSLSTKNGLSLLEDTSTHQLNVGGTQFVIPSQFDPTVLAELPADIREKLVSKTSKTLEHERTRKLTTSNARSRSQSPFIGDTEAHLPSASQLDPEILAALPDDVREEILAEYRHTNKVGTASKSQQLLPQSPRKAKPVANKNLALASKKNKMSSLFARGRPKTKSTSIQTLTQSNFVSLKNNNTSDSLITDDCVSESILDELPEEIRSEILAEQRRHRLKQKSGLDVTTRKKGKAGKIAEGVAGQQKLKLPLTVARPTFTSKQLSTIGELRDAMSSWVQAFCGEGDQGPYQEDTEALGTYLSRVVLEEGDMSKAQAIIDWLTYVIGDWPFDSSAAQKGWETTVAFLKTAVQEAVKERGLQPLHFSM